MNAIAGFLGWLVIWTVVATVAAVVLGKSLKFLGREQPPAPEPEDWDPAPRASVTPLVLPQWRRDDSTRDTPPPSDPAS